MKSQTFEEMQKMIEESMTILESESLTLDTFLLLEGRKIDSDEDEDIGKLIYETLLR